MYSALGVVVVKKKAQVEILNHALMALTLEY